MDIDLLRNLQVFALSLHHVSKTSTRHVRQTHHMYARNEGVKEDDSCNNTSKDDVVIQKLDINDIDQIKQMSKFCIDSFYNVNDDEDTISLLFR